MHTSIIVRDIVGSVPYWAGDETLPKARARFKRLTGKYPSTKASIVAFTGSFEDINNIQINDLGDITCSKAVVKTIIQ